MFETGVFKTIIKNHRQDLKISRGKKYFVTKNQNSAVENSKELAEIFSLEEGAPTDYYPHILSLLSDAVNHTDNAQNAFIIDKCIHNKYTLVTQNRLLGEIAFKYGGRVNNLYEFLKAIK